MDPITLLRMDNRNDDAPQQPKCHQPLLAIGEAVILVRKCDTSKDFFSVDEVKAVLFEIGSTLPFVPADHDIIVYTRRVCVKRGSSQVLTSAR